MKQIFNSIVIAISLTLAVAASAQLEPQIELNSRAFDGTMTAAEYQREFKEMTFSLNSLNNILEDFTWLEKAASNGISEEVIRIINNRVIAAFELLAIVHRDQSLTEQQKKVAIGGLTKALGELFYKVLRHHDIERINIVNKESSTRKMDLAKNVMAEVWGDLRSPFHFDTPASGNKVWSPIEQRQREQLALEILKPLRELGDKALAGLPEGDKARRVSTTMWVARLLPDMLAQREARHSSQKWAVGLYAGLAVIGIVMPMVDMYGVAFGRSEYSLFASSVTYLTLWSAIASVKWASISTKVKTDLVRTIEVFQKLNTDPIMSEGKFRNGMKIAGQVLMTKNKCSQVMLAL